MAARRKGPRAKSLRGAQRGFSKDVRKMLKWAEKSGWTWTLTKKGHIRLQHHKGGLVICSGTPRKVSAVLLAQQEMKRQQEKHT